MGLVRIGYSLQGLPRNRPTADDDGVAFATLPSVNSPPQPAVVDRMDWVFAALLALSVAIACLLIARAMPSFLLQSMDFWFEADTLREVSNMTRVHDDHYRTSVHPAVLPCLPLFRSIWSNTDCRSARYGPCCS